MNEPFKSIYELDRVIHEPGRLMILVALMSVEECDFLYMQKQTGLSKGNLSSHLDRLEGVGYIAVEKTYRGKIPLTLLRITPAGRLALDRYRKGFMEAFLAGCESFLDAPKSDD